MSQARVLSERELKQVLNYCSTQSHSNRNRCLLLLSHLSGMRVGSIAQLTIENVLNTDGTIKDEIRLRPHQVKGNKHITVLISKKLREELKTYLQIRFGIKDLLAVTMTDTSRALFPTQKNLERGFTANTLCQLFGKIYSDCHLDGASSHSGRRSFITRLADRGVGVHVLMSLANHTNISTTQRYISQNPTIMKAAVELL